MNQSKLEVVKQDMARVNVDILGISELKWTGMGEFNSDDHYVYYCGQESLRRNGGQQKSLKCSTWMQSQKWLMISVHFQGKPFNITVIQVYAPTSHARRAEADQFYEDLHELVEHQKEDVLFIIWDWNAKVASQEIPRITGKFDAGVQKNAAEQRLTEFC